MEVYGVVYGSLTVVHNYSDPDADTGECSWAGEGLLQMELKQLVFSQALGKKREIMFGN